MVTRTLLVRVSTLIAASMLSGPALAAAEFERGRADVVAASSSRPLAARGSSAEQAVAGALRSRGRDAATLATLRTVQTRNGRAGMSHVRLEQTVDGLAVYGAYAKAAFDRSGALVHLIDHLAPAPAGGLSPARIDAAQALRAAMARVHPGVAAAFRPVSSEGATTLFDGGSFFLESPRVTAVAVPLNDGSMARGWLVETWSKAKNLLHHVLVSGDGRVLDVERRTANDSYNVFPIDPGKGPQTVVQGPGAGNAQSPAGWLAGRSEKSVNIGGNNVNAYLDSDANNRADSGGTRVTSGNFLAAVNLTAAPTTTGNKAVAVQNLFYLNNVIHDILYSHGFDEAAGNFQVDNFGKGGAGNDSVRAEAQDGSGTDNANFATPPDGRMPRMQMYLWSGAGPSHEVVITSPVSVTYGAKGAEFGAQLSTTGLGGSIAAATPVDGCGATPLGGVNGKIALVNRGSCDFTVKAANAQAGGAIGLIVANNTGGTTIEVMGGTNAAVTIPALMISQNDGAALRGLVAPVGTMRAKAVQPLQIDASLDSDVVFHEYGHGLSWRMIGSMSGPLAGAIGEGASDGVAMLVNGNDVVGEYSSSSPVGIRRYPYAGYPLNYGDVTGQEVHADGEIYGAIVWRMIELFGTSRRGDLFTYYVDGMNFTPATPAYENMRDGILQAVATGGAASAAADACLVWSAFAQFGVGVGASGVVNRNGTVTITPSFATPPGC